MFLSSCQQKSDFRNPNTLEHEQIKDVNYANISVSAYGQHRLLFWVWIWLRFRHESPSDSFTWSTWNQLVVDRAQGHTHMMSFRIVFLYFPHFFIRVNHVKKIFIITFNFHRVENIKWKINIQYARSVPSKWGQLSLNGAERVKSN